jgi:hypothetical protein
MTNYIVTMRFQFPAWDEKDGIEFEVSAANKREANAKGRRQAKDAGHARANRGLYWFKATEAR